MKVPLFNLLQSFALNIAGSKIWLRMRVWTQVSRSPAGEGWVCYGNDAITILIVDGDDSYFVQRVLLVGWLSHKWNATLTGTYCMTHWKNFRSDWLWCSFVLLPSLLWEWVPGVWFSVFVIRHQSALVVWSSQHRSMFFWLLAILVLR